MLAVAMSSFPSWPIRAKLRMDGEMLLLCNEGSQDQDVDGSGGSFLLLSWSFLSGEESKDNEESSFCEPLDTFLIFVSPFEIYEERYMVGNVKPERTKNMNIELGITRSEFYEGLTPLKVL